MDSISDPADCTEKCLTEFDDCTAVVYSSTLRQCYFRNQDCAGNLMPSDASHTLYLVRQAGEDGDGVDSKFDIFKEYDCFPGSNAFHAFGKAGDPSTCKAECLNSHPTCVAVVVWRNKCYFRNNAGCSDSLIRSVGHTTFVRKPVYTGVVSKDALPDSMPRAVRPDGGSSPTALGAFLLALPAVGALSAAVVLAARRRQRPYDRVSENGLELLYDSETAQQ
jgi:hypothetical protein